MALMGLFLGENGSLSDNPTDTVTGVDGAYLNVRDGAGKEYQVLMHLLNGQKVEVIGRDGDWYQIIIPEQVGYVYKDYLNVTDKNPDGSFNITIDQEAMDSLLEPAMGLFFREDTSTPPLTPDGNLTLLDDVGSATGAGKQFITMVTKSGNVFYLIIDRDDKGEENVHFLNLVDEADLFALLDEDRQAAYRQSAVTTPTVEDPNKEVTQTPADETEAADKETETKTDKKGINLLSILFVSLLMAGDAGDYFFLQTRKKKALDRQRPDPEADYSEDDDDE